MQSLLLPARSWLVILALAFGGCQSVNVTAPPSGNPPPVQTNPVTFTVDFHSRADVGTFRATLDPNAGYPTTGGTDITGDFAPPPTPGGQSSATVTVNHPCQFYPAGCIGEHRLRVEADMSPGQAFDSTGHEHVFRLQGTTAPPPPPPPSGPDFRVEITPADQSLAWGGSASYTVTVRSLNGFNQAVALTAADLPDGSTASLSPTSVTPPANGTATSTMTIATSVAVTEVGETEFRVVGTDPGNRNRDDEARLDVLRVAGAFGPNIYPLQSGNSTCGPVTATIAGGPSVQFTSPLGTTNPALAFGPGYDISSDCRVGFVIPPVSGGTPFVNLVNLLFAASTGAPGINNSYDFASVAIESRFSPDGSIVAIVGPGPGGVGGGFSVQLHDVVTHNSSSSAGFDGIITSLNLAGEEVTVTGDQPSGPFSFTLQLP